MRSRGIGASGTCPGLPGKENTLQNSVLEFGQNWTLTLGNWTKNQFQDTLFWKLDRVKMKKSQWNQALILPLSNCPGIFHLHTLFFVFPNLLSSQTFSALLIYIYIFKI
jgi:hypothetical protein